MGRRSDGSVSRLGAHGSLTELFEHTVPPSASGFRAPTDVAARPDTYGSRPPESSRAGHGFVHAPGSSERLRTSSGSLAAATWARVTSPRILRTLARTAIQRGSSDSAGPP